MKNITDLLVMFLCIAAILSSGCTFQQTSPVVSDPGYAGTITARQTPGETVTVRIKDSSFDPPIITINAGTQVVWINEDTLAHRVTYTNKSAGSFDSLSLEPGKSFFYTFNGKGRYEYADSQHSYMKGTIIVV